MEKLAVHFGGGALGRGLVVPLLEQSGYEVVLVDVNDALLERVRADKGYDICLTDAEGGLRTAHVGMLDAISSVHDVDTLRGYLGRASIVTTAVRRENLRHVARSLVADATEESVGKPVVCAENVEHAGELFGRCLRECATTERQTACAESIVAPSTMVDRICSATWPEGTLVNTETFHELLVDSKVMPQTGVELIGVTDSIDAAFARKRLLLNTFADASSFLGMQKGLSYLHEAIVDEEVQGELAPYLAMFDTLLERKYGYRADELASWRERYRTRLSNPLILRDISTVARDLWRKLGVEERFAWPLLELLDMGVDVEPGVAVLVDLIGKSAGEPAGDISRRLEETWGGDERGRRLLEIAERHFA